MISYKPVALLAAILLSAAAPPPADGPSHVFEDKLLDQMAGTWRLTGSAMGKPADHQVEAHWILGHQFFQIHEKSTATQPDGRPHYEAMPTIGYDVAGHRYVAHWLDIYGGRFSETLGFGQRAGDEIRFVFDYPDGPFHTTFRWNATQRTWRWLMEQKDQAGAWQPFADFTLTREPN